jgi:hypothetical protein
VKPVGSEYWILSREKAKLHYKDEFYWEQDPYVNLQNRKLKNHFYREARRLQAYIPEQAFELAVAYSAVELSSIAKEDVEVAIRLMNILKYAKSKLPDKCPHLR